LSPKRRRGRGYRETPDVVAGLKRLIGALGKRVAVEDPDDLRHLLALEREVERAFVVAITGLRSSGYSDTAIGAVFGITKQAVQKRWPR
jgi:hypothetical protein